MKWTPLKRKTAMKRGGKRLPRFSRTGKLKSDVYRAQRRDFLREHPRCEVKEWRPTRLDPALVIASRYAALGGGVEQCDRRSTQVHHVRGRGRWQTDGSLSRNPPRS